MKPINLLALICFSIAACIFNGVPLVAPLDYYRPDFVLWLIILIAALEQRSPIFFAWGIGLISDFWLKLPIGMLGSLYLMVALLLHVLPPNLTFSLGNIARMLLVLVSFSLLKFVLALILRFTYNAGTVYSELTSHVFILLLLMLSAQVFTRSRSLPRY